MDQVKKINFKKIALLSFILMFVVFIIENLIYLIFSEGFFYRGISKAIWSNLLIDNYLTSFIFLTVFSYIRNSLPDKLLKSGIIFGIIIWVVSNGTIAVLYIINKFSAGSGYSDLNYPPQAQAIEYIIKSIFFILSYMLIGFAISYTHKKYLTVKKLS